MLRHAELVIKWQRTLEKIKRIEGYEHLLEPATFGDLKLSAAEGPIIVINVGLLSSHALITCPSGNVLYVNLPKANSTNLLELSVKFSKALEAANVETKVKDVVHYAITTQDDQREDDVRKLLDELWTLVVREVVLKLEDRELGPLRRIWWCPTGPACSLPLHAACIYGVDEHLGSASSPSPPQHFISSYIPSIASLLLARKRGVSRVIRAPFLLLVTQPADDSPVPLAGVLQEKSVIERIVKPSYLTSLHGELGDRKAVLQGMANHAFIHFACHGIASEEDPLRSYFALAHEKLSLLDILTQDGQTISEAECAFLSVCDSASNASAAAADEALHFASGMLLAGFKSVVGTMYPMPDEDGEIIAKEFYQRMGFSDDILRTAQDVARALHETVQVLCRDGEKRRYSKVCRYVHYGV